MNMCDENVESILVLGIGNILQSDDGIGVYIINEMQSREDISLNDVEFLDGGTAGMDLLPLMTGRKKIVIVDALKFEDKPGSIYRFPAEKLYESGDVYSLHDVGVKQIIDMLHIMGEYPHIEIIGIIPEDIDTLNIGISNSVKNSVEKAVELIIETAVL